MPRLEQQIAAWRETMAAALGVGSETLDELECHLRESIDQLLRSGMTETEAFRMAVAQLGSPPAISREFAKLTQPFWLPAKVAMGAGILAALALAALCAVRIADHGLSLLLAAHIFTVTLGYVTAFLLGGLGICFVCQRCFSDFIPARLQSLSRINCLLGGLAAGLTAAGIGLGMVWAKAEWGRFWAWDPKETAALCVLVWLICFAAAQRSRWAATRGVLLPSILGNVIVSLAWFGPHLPGGLYNYGTSNHLMLALAMAAHFAFFLIGLAPARWLRLRQA